MTVRLRAHHLLCMLTYTGKGYNPAFEDNFDAIAQLVSSGEEVLIIDGPDDICSPLLNDANAHCRCDNLMERDRLAAQEVGALLGRPVDAGQHFALDSTTLAKMRRAFAENRVRSACAQCPWHDLCTAVAAHGFAGAKF